MVSEVVDRDRDHVIGLIEHASSGLTIGLHDWTPNTARGVKGWSLVGRGQEVKECVTQSQT